LYDRDPGTSESGQVEYSEGTVIGKAGNFPSLESEDVLDTSFDLNNLGGSEQGTDDLYSDLVSSGFTGEKVRRKNSEILYGLQDSSDANFKLYGDLVCGDPNEDGMMKWYMCHDNPEFSTVAGYQCDTSGNEWVEQ